MFFSLQAEAWLNEQAQAMGWAKATKLAGRKALQGLVAVKYDKNHGALVELNCETDFVAKNDKFQKVLEDATLACYKFAHTHLQAKGPITKVSYSYLNKNVYACHLHPIVCLTTVATRGLLKKIRGAWP